LFDSLGELEIHEAELINRQAELKAQAEQPIEEISKDQLQRIIANFDHLIESADNYTKREIFSAIIESVHIDRDKKKLFGTITFLYPPPTLNAKSPSADGEITVPMNRRSRREWTPPEVNQGRQNPRNTLLGQPKCLLHQLCRIFHLKVLLCFQN
jgi:hypothetical protein